MQTPSDETIKHRAFKISINILFYSVYSNTRSFEIKNNFTLALLGFWFSLVSLMLGWWGGRSITRPFDSIKNTLEAIYINLNGGIDFSKEINEMDYDEKTNFVWNNLLRKTTEKLKKDEVAIILEIQEEYESLNKELFSDENINYIIISLGKVDIHRIARDEIRDILDGVKSYLEG